MSAPDAGILARLAVRQSGLADRQPVMFIHGYGANQSVWAQVAPAFERDHRVILLDNAGAGESAPGSWDPERHGSLWGYAQDVNAVAAELNLRKTILVGHSVGGMVGALAAASQPDRYARLVMVAPSARFLNDEGYVGGFDRAQIEQLVVALDRDYAGWVRAMAPRLVGATEGSGLAQTLERMLSEATPLAQSMARSFLFADHRAQLEQVRVPTLVMQGPDDPFVPLSVARDVERRLPDGHLVQLGAAGHFPILSAPGEVIAAVRSFLERAEGVS